MNDIVLNDGTFDENGTYTPGASGKAAEKWTPIAYSGLFNEHTTLYYTGTFDGQGHTIKGLYVYPTPRIWKRKSVWACSAPRKKR